MKLRMQSRWSKLSSTEFLRQRHEEQQRKLGHIYSLQRKRLKHRGELCGRAS